MADDLVAVQYSIAGVVRHLICTREVAELALRKDKVEIIWELPEWILSDNEEEN